MLYWMIFYNHIYWKGNILLVGGLAHFLFSHSVGNVIIPTDKLICFRGVAQPPTRSPGKVLWLNISDYTSSHIFYREIKVMFQTTNQIYYIYTYSPDPKFPAVFSRRHDRPGSSTLQWQRRRPGSAPVPWGVHMDRALEDDTIW